MSYAVKEIYYTIQGEGLHAGRPAVFLRFTGCNLWSGLEKDRATAICKFCDTDFVGTDGPNGGQFATASDLAQAVVQSWNVAESSDPKPFVVCTGGEPLLQMDDALIEAFHAVQFEVAVETNGTRQPPAGIDWLCVSPKAGAPLVVNEGDELKLVYPQLGAEPELYDGMQFKHFYLQPEYGMHTNRNTQLAVEYCLKHPHWRISFQRQKILGIA